MNPGAVFKSANAKYPKAEIIYALSVLALGIYISLVIILSLVVDSTLDDSTAALNAISNFTILFSQTSYLVLTFSLWVLITANPLIKRAKWLVEGIVILVIIVEMLTHGKLEGLGSDSVREISNSNPQEIADYIFNYLLYIPISDNQWLSIIVLCIPASLIRATEKNIPQRTKAIVFTVSLISISAILAYKFYETVQSIRSNYYGIENFVGNIQKGNASYAGALEKTKTSHPHIIVYIGESTAKANMGLYGYYNNTTEPLQPYRNDLIVFSNVVSPYSATFPSLYRSLTVARDPYLDQFLLIKEVERASIVNLLNQNGIKTKWLSNQNIAGSWDWTSQLFGKHATESRFLNKKVGNFYGAKRKFDSELVNLYLSEDSGKSDVDFLHSYAGHVDYCKNIPEKEYIEFDDPLLKSNVFPSLQDMPVVSRLSLEQYAKTVRCYDSAVHFISKNIAGVLKKVSESKEPTVFIYFSDHGEDVFGITGHDSRTNSFRHLEIPFVVYFNAAARKEYSEQYGAALKNKDAPYSLEWVSDSILDLSGIKNTKRPLLSVFSDAPMLPKRYSLARTTSNNTKTIIPIDDEDESAKHGFVTAGDDIFRKRRLISKSGDMGKKICAHDVNTALKWFDAEKIFDCLEVNIVFDKAQNGLFVSNTASPGSKLPLSDLLKFKSENVKTMIFSLINLDSSNADTVQRLLNDVLPIAKQEQILVEISKGLEDKAVNLRKAGYRLFYTVPEKIHAQCSSSPEGADCVEMRSKVSDLVKNNMIDGLAVDINDVAFIDSIGISKNVKLIVRDVSNQHLSEANQSVLKRSDAYIVPLESRFEAKAD